ncbi:amidohydrolase family protein [Actinoplanes sp. NPDC049596]|uniref:amidohydrolase family protein n=1 Tax=Actinoplanes sp. NPDC049596 TaxID=3154625 RepID=UPI003435AE5A
MLDFGVDAFLMPGLIDPHVHLAFDAGTDVVASLSGADDATLVQRMRAAARRALAAGITTVRDLGDRNFLASAVTTGPVPATDLPEILFAGPPITTSGGHCFFLGGIAEGPEELRAAVRERHRRGCHVVKVMDSGGTMTAGTDPEVKQYSRSDLAVIVEEAHALGLPVAVHAHGTDAIADAVAVGADSVEHASFFEAGEVRAPEDLLNAIADSSTVVSITLGTVPGGPTSQLPAFVLDRLDAMFAVYRSLHARGARLTIGSDAGINALKPHDVLPYGVQALSSRGFDTREALAAATSVAATVCGVGHRKGAIVPGADADLLVVRKNPLDDLARLRQVLAVFRAGVRVPDAVP